MAVVVKRQNTRPQRRMTTRFIGSTSQGERPSPTVALAAERKLSNIRLGFGSGKWQDCGSGKFRTRQLDGQMPGQEERRKRKRLARSRSRKAFSLIKYATAR